MNRTDTTRLPRIVATAAHPLAVPTPRRPPRWRAIAAAVLLFAVGVAVAFYAGHALAWTQQPVVTVTYIDPVTLTGTDAGLVTEPAR